MVNWRRGRYSDYLRWGQDAPKRKDKKNLLLLCYDTLVSHSKEEDHSISPLDKQVARYRGGLLKTRLPQQRISAHHADMKREALVEEETEEEWWSSGCTGDIDG